MREIAAWVAAHVTGVTWLAAGFLLAACGDPAHRWETGGIYSVSDGDGFGIVKILALDGDPDAVSVRIYRERFETRPTSIDPAALTLGGIGDPEGFSIGHIPLAPRDFALWFPVHLVTEPVSEEELAGYRVWKEAGAGAFSFEALAEEAGTEPAPDMGEAPETGAAAETEDPR